VWPVRIPGEPLGQLTVTAAWDNTTSGCGAAWIARLTGGQEVGGSNPLTPTFLRNEPFGENVEGLSYCGYKTYAVERPVQTDDFEDATFGGVVGRKPLLPQALRKFKRFHRNVDDFVAPPVADLDFQLQLGSSVSQVSVR